MTNYFDAVMAAIPDTSNTASKSSAFDKWIQAHDEWGFSAEQLVRVANKITTSNTAVLGSMAGKLVGTFEPYRCVFPEYYIGLFRVALPEEARRLRRRAGNPTLLLYLSISFLLRVLLSARLTGL